MHINTQECRRYDGGNLLVYSNFLKNPCVLEAVKQSWPDANYDGWHSYNDKTALKRTTRCRSDLTPQAALVLDTISLEYQPPGDMPVFADMQYYGAGMHELPTGGFLKPHLDAMSRPSKHWIRTYSGVLIVDAKPDSGGVFQYMCANGVVIDVPPVPNTFVLFTVTSLAVHGVTMTSESRKSLCVFWWQQGNCLGLSNRSVFFDTMAAPGLSAVLQRQDL